jgi:urate oxidase
MPVLAAARYGKDNVRVYKVHKDQSTGVQTVTEMTVCCLLEGQIDTSYTEADNSVVVATDSIKNTIYITAKENPVNPPELYASILGSHFLQKYGHINVANIKVVTHRWTRMTVDGHAHPHSFYRDSEETRNVEARVARDGISLKSSIAGLTVLKSTGSAFHGFVRDEFTTLPETWDRILSTEVDASWVWNTFADLKAAQDGVENFDPAWEAARKITMKTFAEDASASVQNTMYKMCEQILEAVPTVNSVTYSLPNKHYFEIGMCNLDGTHIHPCHPFFLFLFFFSFFSFSLFIGFAHSKTNVEMFCADLSWHNGLQNTGKDAEVYAPQSGPNGLIKCEVARS